MIGAQEGTLRLAFVGDIALGNHPKTPGFGFYSRYRAGIQQELALRVCPPGLLPDVVFGNLEFPLICDDDHPGTNACCLGVVSCADFLHQAGFTVLNVANNHSWDYGAGVFEDTVNSLQKAGIKVVGIPNDFDPAGYLRIKGRTVAFLGCSSRPRKDLLTKPGYNEFNKDRFFHQIQEARRQADLVCISIHWGEEFVLLPSEWEREVAHAMIDAGADVVVGHHPHVLREVEDYGGGIIAYSLGNFIGDMSWNPLNRETGCLFLEIKNSRIYSSSFLPATIENDYFPRYLDEGDSQKLFNLQERRHRHLSLELKTSNYQSIAKKALKSHQWLTLLFLIRNLPKYKISTLVKIIYHGISVRLHYLKR